MKCNIKYLLCKKPDPNEVSNINFVIYAQQTKLRVQQPGT